MFSMIIQKTVAIIIILMISAPSVAEENLAIAKILAHCSAYEELRRKHISSALESGYLSDSNKLLLERSLASTKAASRKYRELGYMYSNRKYVDERYNEIFGIELIKMGDSDTSLEETLALLEESSSRANTESVACHKFFKRDLRIIQSYVREMNSAGPSAPNNSLKVDAEDGPVHNPGSNRHAP